MILAQSLFWPKFLPGGCQGHFLGGATGDKEPVPMEFSDMTYGDLCAVCLCRFGGCMSMHIHGR